MASPLPVRRWCARVKIPAERFQPFIEYRQQALAFLC
jgi:hypothetical protein